MTSGFFRKISCKICVICRWNENESRDDEKKGMKRRG